MNETMNKAIIYNDADVRVNWVYYVWECPYELRLSDDKADKYNFSNAILMRVMHAQLVEALWAKRNYI